MRIAPFAASAFPYDGEIPDQHRPFLDVNRGGRRGHTSPRGGILWADQTYSDRNTLLYVPGGFDIRRPAAIVVYFHGNLARLGRDVAYRQRVPRQLFHARLNAVLVAPQMAVDALDSSAGHFWERNFFAKYMNEAATHLAELTGLPASRFNALPIIIVAYSGGYLPAIYSATVGGTGVRIGGIVLLDALFGETDAYADWIAHNRNHAFFLSAYSRASETENIALRSTLDKQGIDVEQGLPSELTPGTIAFLGARDAVHNDFVTRAFTLDPLEVILAHIKAYRH
ncbi:MAG TPA: hypothetical protein VL492_12110 [Methylovirgula sp.]|nr:hypothetical protein [Methylovirgula sp.]